MEKETTPQSQTPQLNTAEKEVAHFIDAFIDREADKMRSYMTDSFQNSYNFEAIKSEHPQKKIPISFRLIRTSKEAGSITVVVEILFENQKSGSQKAIQYSYELIKDSNNQKLLINSEKNLKAAKPFYKKPLFWILAITGLALIGALIFWVVTARKTTQNQQAIKSGWHLVVDGAKEVNSASANATQDQASFDSYSKKLNDYRSLIGDVKFKADQIKPSSSDKDDLTNYKNALNTLNDYIAEASNQSKNVAELTTADSTKLEELSDVAEKATNKFQDSAKFLSDKMPAEIFDIEKTLAEQNDKIEEAKLKEQEAQNAAAEATARDAADKTAVTNNITIFQQGFIAGNANQMRPVMTTGFQGEYNFNQLTPEQRQYQYPSSFRIINVTKQPDGTYKAQVNVLNKYIDNPNQYTQGYEYSVISQSGKWLINNEKTVNEF